MRTTRLMIEAEIESWYLTLKELRKTKPENDPDVIRVGYKIAMLVNQLNDPYEKKMETPGYCETCHYDPIIGDKPRCNYFGDNRHLVIDWISAHWDPEINAPSVSAPTCPCWHISNKYKRSLK